MIHADVLGERSRLTPDKTALVDIATGQQWTYGELDRRARACASMWRELGALKGDRVAILSHNRPEYIEAFAAAGKSGVILVTLGTRLTAHELAHIVQDAQPKILLYESSFGDKLAKLGELLAAAMPQLICFDGDGETGSDSALYETRLADQTPEAYEPPICDGEDVYCLLYTSGTTGAPKGVMIPHRMVAWNGYNTACCWQLREDDVSPIFTPLYHAGGLLAFLVPIMTIGGTLVLHRSFDEEEIWRTIAEQRCTVVLGVPTIYRLLMESPAFEGADLSSLRWMISGGAPLPHYLIEAYQERGVVFKQGFGMTEVGVNCFSMTVEESKQKIGSIGKPMMFTEVRIVDEDGQDVADGEVGEMLFRGPHVSLGYWRNEAATEKAYDSDGFYHSGDQARRDEDGFFYVAGRAKDMFISGGVNIYPAEIEGALLQHPQVEDAAVIGAPDEKWGEIGVAYLVPRPGDGLEIESVEAHLEDRLARFKRPREYRLIDALPRNDYGKIVKPRLRELFEEEIAAATAGEISAEVSA